MGRRLRKFSGYSQNPDFQPTIIHPLSTLVAALPRCVSVALWLKLLFASLLIHVQLGSSALSSVSSCAQRKNGRPRRAGRGVQRMITSLLVVHHDIRSNLANLGDRERGRSVKPVERG